MKNSILCLCLPANSRERYAKTKRYIIQFASLLLFLVSTEAWAYERMSDRQMLKALKQELDRSVELLSQREPPLFYLSYELTTINRTIASSLFGQLTSSTAREFSVVDIDLRVGSPELDNKRELRNVGGFQTRVPSYRIPVNDPLAMRTHLWRTTDVRYKLAAERLRQVQADVQLKTSDDEPTNDFAISEGVRGTAKSTELRIDQSLWEDKIASYSEPFARHTDLLTGAAYFNAQTEDVFFVNSEGSSIKTANITYRVSISADAQDEDGANVFRYKDFYAMKAEDLPDDKEILAASAKLGDEVIALLDAEDLSSYNGPAILSGRATGVFFHEVLGHRLEGHRLKSTRDAQTFKEQVNKPILPKSFSVYFDPTVTHFEGIALNGSYKFDNEGIKAQRVDVVENGVLKSFLMSRSPIPGFSTSNGHGRKARGYASVSRQSNLIVEVSDTVSHDELKAQLLEMVKERGLEFGLLIDDISGGFTFTDRYMPNSFRVSSTVVYKIHLDGSEELVRGVNLIGTPLTAFSNIVAASDEYNVFNGICGAESGSVPVSAVAPAVLIRQVEVQKQQKSQESLPILSKPQESPSGV